MLLRSVLLCCLLPAAVVNSAPQWSLRRFARSFFFFNGPRMRRAPRSAMQGAFAAGDAIWTAGATSMEWGALDDVVMGGVSASGWAEDGSVGVWEGVVSTERNGGFCGVRTRTLSPALDMSSCKGFRLRVRGDGQRYKFIIRDSTEWNGIAWSMSFDTREGQWITVDAPFSEFKPTKFARVLEGAGPFNRESVTALQFTLSKFEYSGDLNPSFRTGPFRFDVESVSAL